MSDVPVQLVVAAFEEEKAADEVLWGLKEAKWAGLIGIQNAAVLRRDQKNKLHIKETGDWGGGKGAAAGAVLGGFVGLLAGPVGWLGLTGAVIGGLAAKLRDSGFSDERLKKLGEGLKPGTSAIVAVIEHRWVAEMEKEMAEAGADVVTEELAADIAQQLEAADREQDLVESITRRVGQKDAGAARRARANAVAARAAPAAAGHHEHARQEEDEERNAMNR